MMECEIDRRDRALEQSSSISHYEVITPPTMRKLGKALSWLLFVLLFGTSSHALTTPPAPVLRRSWMAPKLGDISKLELIEESIDLASCPPGTVTVEVAACGLNFADVWTVLGFYKAAPASGVVPGIEFCGRVVQSSSSSNGVAVGTAVFGFTRFGGYSTHVTVDENFVRPLPSGWSCEEGAAFLVQALTAWHGLELADLGERCDDFGNAGGT